MSALLMVFVCTRLNILNQSLTELTRASSNSHHPARIVVVNRLGDYGLLDCVKVVEYYRNILNLWYAKGNDVLTLEVIVKELIVKHEKSTRLKIMLAEFIERHPVVLRRVVKLLYKSPVINDAILCARLLKVCKKYYNYFENVKMADCDINQLKSWLDMCQCRCMLHDNSLIQQCLQGLADTRVINDLTRAANYSFTYPEPTRVCDYCIMSLLYYSQADIFYVFDNNGLRRLSWIDYIPLNMVMFDNVIRNRDKYLKLE